MFCTEIKIHPEFLKQETPAEVYDGVHDGVHDQNQVYLNQTELKILGLIQDTPVGLAHILDAFGYKVVTRNLRNALQKLLKLQLVAYTVPDKPRSKKQQYKITELGKDKLNQL